MPNEPTKMWSGRFREPLNRTFEQWQRSFPFVSRCLAAGLCIAAFSAAARAQSYRTVYCSLSKLSLGKGERIIGIEIDGHAAAFKNLINLPVGWKLSVDNSPSWQSKLEGSLQVGSAALDVHALEQIRIAMYRYEFGGLHFGVSGKVIVTSDYQKERTIELSSDNFSLSEKQQ